MSRDLTAVQQRSQTAEWAGGSKGYADGLA